MLRVSNHFAPACFSRVCFLLHFTLLQHISYMLFFHFTLLQHASHAWFLLHFICSRFEGFSSIQKSSLFFFKFKSLESLVSFCCFLTLSLTSLVNVSTISLDYGGFSDSVLYEYLIEDDDYHTENNQSPVVNFALISFFFSSISIDWSIDEEGHLNCMNEMSLESL